MNPLILPLKEPHETYKTYVKAIEIVNETPFEDHQPNARITSFTDTEITIESDDVRDYYLIGSVMGMFAYHSEQQNESLLSLPDSEG